MDGLILFTFLAYVGAFGAHSTWSLATTARPHIPQLNPKNDSILRSLLGKLADARLDFFIIMERKLMLSVHFLGSSNSMEINTNLHSVLGDSRSEHWFCLGLHYDDDTNPYLFRKSPKI